MNHFSKIIHSLLLLLLITSSFTDAVEGNENSSKDDDTHTDDNQQVCKNDQDQTCLATKPDIDPSSDPNDMMGAVLVNEDDDDDYYDDDHVNDDGDDWDEEYDYVHDNLDKDDPMASLCADDHPQCQEWADMNECDNNPNYMLKKCRQSCKVCTSVETYGLEQKNDKSSTSYKEVLDIIQKMETYMRDNIITNPDLKYLAPRCKNRHEECAFWAHEGECDANPSYMLTNCAPVCNTCHLLDYTTRCPIPPDAVDAIKEGDLNAMFERIVNGDNENVDSNNSSNYYNVKDVNILSRPASLPQNTAEDLDHKYKTGPWVITIDNFIKDDECEQLIKLGAVEGYERSEDVGAEKFDGSFDSVQSTSRTSHNAWCLDECSKDPHAKAVMARIEKLTRVPGNNSESLQLLRYHEGQFYKTHHDFIDKQEKFPAGPRILTAFLYLGDVEGGGGTDFPRLGITVHPKKGRLLLWPSVLDSDPYKIDRRTTHQALPVEKGIKYAANAWIHLRDFQTPNANSCA